MNTYRIFIILAQEIAGINYFSEHSDKKNLNIFLSKKIGPNPVMGPKSCKGSP